MKFLAFDSPVLDVILMRREDLESKIKNVLLKEDVLKVYDELYVKLIERGDRPGDKNNLEVAEEIDYINTVLHKLQQKLPVNLPLLYLGGSACRKLHHVVASLCDSEAALIGATKDDAEGEFLRSQLKRSNIELLDNGVTLATIRKSLIYTLKNESDRVILRFPFKVPSELYSNLDFCREKIEESDVVLMETSRINMFGENAFRRILEVVEELNRKIIFYPPTFAGLLAYEENKKLIHKAAWASTLMTMNAEEGISTFLDRQYRGKVKSLEDGNLLKLISILQENMNLKQLAIVTLGKLGAMGITKKYKIHVAAKMVDKTVNTLGAGDSFSGGAAARYFAQYIDKELSVSEIEDVLSYGVDLASVVIQQPGGLIDPSIVACMR